MYICTPKFKLTLSEFNEIRPFNDEEVSQVLSHLKENETMRGLLDYGFPSLNETEKLNILLSCKEITDFQQNIMYPIIKKAIDRSVTTFSHSGFEDLDKNKAYLFISNHRDIILDTSFLNVILHDVGLKMTASAIGDNLVKKPFLLALAKMNRNFLIHRGLPPKEMLMKSKIVSKFIHRYLVERNRSVWIAQREGRTKDGNDFTQQGVLKMLSLNCPKEMSAMQYFKTLNIVPMAISYEFDPTDMLKMPAVMAQINGEIYTKTKNEDFNNIVQGFLGKKGRVHLEVSQPLDLELDKIEKSHTHINQQLQALGEVLDHKIYNQYQLWPSNFVAYDQLLKTNQFSKNYSEEEKKQFQRRILKGKINQNHIMEEKFLEMYANPVKNKLKIKKLN